MQIALRDQFEPGFVGEFHEGDRLSAPASPGKPGSVNTAEVFSRAGDE
jgi:hypothetical protein